MRAAIISSIALGALLFTVNAHGQCTDGRVFLSTPETIGIWEMNNLPVGPGEVLVNGTVIPDLSGNGLDAVVEGNSNTIGAGLGDPTFDAGDTVNASAVKLNGSGAPRLAVNDDTAFQFTEKDDWSLELYIRRDETAGNQSWGMLAGTWHSRNVANKGVCPNCDFNCRNTEGHWYGWGLMRHGGDNEAWTFNLSPVNLDGSPMGQGCCNEQNPGPVIEFTPGFPHYFAASIDRTEQVARYYLDGVEIATVFLQPEWSFITPPGRDSQRFVMFTGEDDRSCNAYRGAPDGYHIDAARVQRRALDPLEVEDTWFFMQDGAPSPPEASNQAVLSVSAAELIVGQCVRLSGEASCVNEGETITQYEWKIGDGAFEVSEGTREMSFDAPTGPEGIEVTLRITSSGGGTSTASQNIVVRLPDVVARVDASLAGEPQPGREVSVAVGSVLTLDGSASATIVPPGAFTCPLDVQSPVAASPIEEYLWDLDSDGTTDSTEATVKTAPLAEGEFTILLTVRNDMGSEATATLDVRVVETRKTGGRIFDATDDTIAIYEFNNLIDDGFLVGDAIPNDTVLPDLSGNDLDATVEANEGGDLVIGEGDAIFDNPDESNFEVRRIADGSAARIAVNDDNDAFEMEPDEDFTIELYVNREDVQGANWGILAGTWHSRNLLDDAGVENDEGAWYGYGLIRYTQDPTCVCPEGSGGWRWVFSPVVDGIPRIGFGQAPEQHTLPGFEIPPGRHYVVVSVDRTANVDPNCEPDPFDPNSCGMGTAVVYVDGVQLSSRNIPVEWSFTTPDGYEHARFILFEGEDDPTRDQYRASPLGVHLDAVRVRQIAMSEEDIQSTWNDIRGGVTSPPARGVQFIRGDTDTNGRMELTDAIGIFNFLFITGIAPLCIDAADADDNGTIELTDGIRILNVLFLGFGEIPPPGFMGCGLDPTEDGLAECVHEQCL